MKLKSDQSAAIQAQPPLSSTHVIRATPAECLDYLTEMIAALRAMANDNGSQRLGVLLKLAHEEALVQRSRADRTADSLIEDHEAAKPHARYSRSVRNETS